MEPVTTLQPVIFIKANQSLSEAGYTRGQPQLETQEGRICQWELKMGNGQLLSAALRSLSKLSRSYGLKQLLCNN